MNTNARKANIVQKDNLLYLRVENEWYCYDLLSTPLGEGAMGTVYLGYSCSSNEQVAVKRVIDKYANVPSIRARARLEASLLFRHPNLVEMIGYCEFNPNNGPIFIISRLIHVAKPWEYSDEEMKKNLGTDVDEFINSQIPQELPYDERANVIVKAYNTPSHFIWKMILLQAQKTNSTTIDGINSLIRQIRKCKTTISGKNAYIRVGYPGRNYSDDNHYDACTVKKASESRDADIAILQLDSKKTPDDIKKIFDVDKFYTKQLDPLKDRLYWIGYPRGNACG